MRWLDASAYTEELAPSFLQAAVENGVEGLAVQLHGGNPLGTGLNQHRNQQLDLARSLGLRLAGYSWPSSAAGFAIDSTPGYDLDFVGLDVEAGYGMTRADVNDAIARGVQPVKYASPHTWSTIMGNTNAFRDVDTWLAYYLQTGWKDWNQVQHLKLLDGSRTMMVQIQGTTTLQDDQFDLNVADRAWFPTAPAPPQEDEMRVIKIVPPVTLQNYHEGQTFVLGEMGKRWIDDPNELAAYLQAGYVLSDVLDFQIANVPDIPLPLTESKTRQIVREEIILPTDGSHSHGS